MKMTNISNHKGVFTKIFLFFTFAILFSQVFLYQVVADETRDGYLEINEGDWINIQCGTTVTIIWQFQVDTNARAIYWEITGYKNYFKTGWGPNANFTTPILNETDTRYEYVCNGYYAKYHVWSTMIITCTETGQTDGGGDNSFDPMMFFYIGVPIVAVIAIASGVAVYLRRKKKKDFF